MLDETWRVGATVVLVQLSIKQVKTNRKSENMLRAVFTINEPPNLRFNRTYAILIKARVLG